MKHDHLTMPLSWLVALTTNTIAWLPTVDVVTKLAAMVLAIVSAAYTIYKFYRQVQRDLHTIEKESDKSE